MRRFWILALCLGALFFFPQGRAEDETKAWCEQLGRRLHSVAAESCRAWAFVPGTERSVGKHPLMRIDFPPPVPAREVARITRQSGRSAPRPVRIFLIGGIHGDELTSVSIVFRWMDWIAEPQANKYHWRIAPLANPDGLLARPARRTNGHGVDLNRNFPTPDWSRDALSYWSKRTDRDPRRYPGTGPMSEPETRWLTQEIRDFRPDVIVSVHAPYGILDYDGPMQKPRRFGHLNLSQLGVYPGSLGNFGGVHKNIPVVTIELPHATSMPSAAEQRKIWEDMLAWIQKYIAPQTLALNRGKIEGGTSLRGPQTRGNPDGL